MDRTCGLCGQSIPKSSKLAQLVAGRTRQEVLANFPGLARPEELELRTSPDGMLWIEACMSCWLRTGGSR